MHFTIQIDKVVDEQKAKLIARYIGSKGTSLSFSSLIEIVQSEFFTFPSKFSKDEMELTSHQLKELGVTFSVKQVEDSIPPKVIPTTPVQPVRPTPKKKVVETPIVNEPSAPVPQSKNRHKVFIPLSLFIGLGIFLLFSINMEKNNIVIPSSPLSKTNLYSSSTPSKEPVPSNNSSQENQAKIVLDSADLKCGSAGSDAEKLYQIAISFNKLNKNAWFGLLNCYTTLNQSKKKNKTISQMKLLFGDSILEPQFFTKEFGRTEVLTTQGQSVSFVYIPKSKQPELYSDLFQITRRFNAIGKHQSLTILAKQNDGTGLFMKMPIGTCITYSDFIKQADIQVLK